MKPNPSRMKVVGLITFVLLLTGHFGTVSAADSDRQALEAELANLLVCYARGADAIGDGRSNHDPEAAGLEIFRKCFTEGATFAIWPAGQPFDRPEFPSRVGTMPPLAIFPGPAAWAKFTNSSFRSSGYDYVQHLIGNIVVKVSGDNATVVGYLNSTHVTMGDGLLARSQCMQQSNGTYSLRVRKFDSGWKVTSLDLAQFAYNTIIESGAGCS